jgi:hypothetical protein
LFNSCVALTTVNLPNLLTTSGTCFDGCILLTTVSLPNLVTGGSGDFNGCSALETINLPAIVTLGDEYFEGCTSLTTISLPICTALGSTTGDNNVFFDIIGQTIALTVQNALMICNAGNPDGDIQYLQANNDVNIITDGYATLNLNDNYFTQVENNETTNIELVDQDNVEITPLSLVGNTIEVERYLFTSIDSGTITPNSIYGILSGETI